MFKKYSPFFISSLSREQPHSTYPFLFQPSPTLSNWAEDSLINSPQSWIFSVVYSMSSFLFSISICLSPLYLKLCLNRITRYFPTNLVSSPDFPISVSLKCYFYTLFFIPLLKPWVPLRAVVTTGVSCILQMCEARNMLGFDPRPFLDFIPRSHPYCVTQGDCLSFRVPQFPSV